MHSNKMGPPCLSFALIGIIFSVAAAAQKPLKTAELHANGDVTAADVGLPVYPGSRLSKSSDNGSAVDLGFTFGGTHFRLVAANYVSNDSAAKIVDFYRKPLARYGEVLECDHGKPVGATRATRSGLTCDSDESSESHELRAGTREKFRIVGIGEREGAATHFGLVYLEIPKNSDSSTE